MSDACKTPCLSSSSSGHDGRSDWVCDGCTEHSGVWCVGSSSRADGGGHCRAQSSEEACSWILHNIEDRLIGTRQADMALN